MEISGDQVGISGDLTGGRGPPGIAGIAVIAEIAVIGKPQSEIAAGYVEEREFLLKKFRGGDRNRGGIRLGWTRIEARFDTNWGPIRNDSFSIRQELRLDSTGKKLTIGKRTGDSRRNPKT